MKVQSEIVFGIQENSARWYTKLLGKAIKYIWVGFCRIRYSYDYRRNSCAQPIRCAARFSALTVLDIPIRRYYSTELSSNSRTATPIDTSLVWPCPTAACLDGTAGWTKPCSEEATSLSISEFKKSIDSLTPSRSKISRNWINFFSRYTLFNSITTQSAKLEPTHELSDTTIQLLQPNHPISSSFIKRSTYPSIHPLSFHMPISILWIQFEF